MFFRIAVRERDVIQGTHSPSRPPAPLVLLAALQPLAHCRDQSRRGRCWCGHSDRPSFADLLRRPFLHRETVRSDDGTDCRRDRAGQWESSSARGERKKGEQKGVRTRHEESESGTGREHVGRQGRQVTLATGSTTEGGWRAHMPRSAEGWFSAGTNVYTHERMAKLPKMKPMVRPTLRGGERVVSWACKVEGEACFRGEGLQSAGEHTHPHCRPTLDQPYFIARRTVSRARRTLLEDGRLLSACDGGWRRRHRSA